MPIIKLYIGMALRRLKKISNIKSFSSVFFHFHGFEWNMMQLEQRDFWKSTVEIDKSPVFWERNLISSGLCLD